MSTTEMNVGNAPFSNRSREENRSREGSKELSRDRGNGRSFERYVANDPQPNTWMTVSAGAVVPLGLACAATLVTYLTSNERVAVTAWVSVAVVGTAAVIAADSVSRRRIVRVDRSNQGHRTLQRGSDNQRDHQHEMMHQ